MRDHRLRSIIKALSWRAFGTLDTFMLGYLITGHLGTAGAIAGAEWMTKTALYYLHERLWAVIKWGRIPAEPTPALAHTL